MTSQLALITVTSLSLVALILIAVRPLVPRRRPDSPSEHELDVQCQDVVLGES